MTDLVVYRPVKEQSLATRARQIVARIAQAIERALVAARIQRELSALPDLMLRDIGLNRSDIGFVAPFRYTALLWAIFLGWAAFGTLPDALTLLGAALIVGSGIFTLWRERKLKGTAPA